MFLSRVYHHCWEHELYVNCLTTDWTNLSHSICSSRPYKWHSPHRRVAFVQFKMVDSKLSLSLDLFRTEPLCFQIWMSHHKHVWTVPPSNFLSIRVCIMHVCLSICVASWLRLCVYISHGAVCYEVIVSCRGSSMVKVMQVGSCQMAVHPSLGQGVPVPPDRACGAKGRRGGSEVDVVPCCLGPAPGCRASSPGYAAASSCFLYSSMACPVTC